MSARKPSSAPTTSHNCPRPQRCLSRSTSCPWPETNEETARLADLIEGVAGELSPFEELHGFSIDGVDLETAVLPDGWRNRLVKVQNANTAAAAGEPRFTGWCLDKEDLCVAKLVALREKDRNFVTALLKAHLVEADLIESRLRTIPNDRVAARQAALTWLKASLKALGR